MAKKNSNDGDNKGENKPPSNDVVWFKPGDALPKVLDPDVTMELVQQYVETERNRSRKVLLWISSFFLFIVLLILVVFLSIGLFVLRSSKNTVDLVENIRADAAVYETRVIGMTDKVSRAEKNSKKAANMVEKSAEERQEENEMFKQNLKRFSKWIADGNSKKTQLISVMEARLEEVEDKNKRQLAEFENLREQYLELVESAGSRPDNVAAVAVVAPVPVAVEPATVEPVVISSSDPDSASEPIDLTPLVVSDVPVVKDSLWGTATATATAIEPVKPVAAPSPSEISNVTFPNGDKYRGAFKNGLFHGWGKYTYRNGEVYEGDFRSDMKHGTGSFLYATGDKYSGDFRNDMRHGKGSITFTSGERYTGEFKGDVVDGKGSWTYNNGNKYAGDFKNGLRHGNGELRFDNGDIYRGEFVQDRRTGQGNYLFSDGAKYIGSFQNGKRHGQGRYIYPGGEEFKGTFKDGMKDGSGECVYPNGTKIKGLWRKDKFVKKTEN